MSVDYRWRGDFTNPELDRLHAEGFGHNLLDYDGLKLHVPEIRYDMPMNGRRLLQRAEGYKHTFVSGVETFRDGSYLGATPGRLVRAR